MGFDLNYTFKAICIAAEQIRGPVADPMGNVGFFQIKISSEGGNWSRSVDIVEVRKRFATGLY